MNAEPCPTSCDDTFEQRVLFDSAKPGDPVISDIYVSKVSYCDERGPDRIYSCTRSKGHTGQHVAEGTDVIAVWPAS